MALCRNDDCGRITTLKHDGLEPERGLEAFLLDNPPPARLLKPWNRLYFRSIARGFVWRSHQQPCWDCEAELTVALDLPMRPDRQADPFQAVLCLICGALATFYVTLGEQTALVIKGPRWEEPDLSIRLLRMAIDERDPPDPTDGARWHFG